MDHHRPAEEAGLRHRDEHREDQQEEDRGNEDVARLVAEDHPVVEHARWRS